MKRTALVLAAHGSRSEPAVNEQIGGYAEAIAARNLFDEVAAAFHHGNPSFSTVLDRLTADDVTVVPVMTSVGYYSDIVLPCELARNDRYSHVETRQTAPLGTHASIIDLVADRVRCLIERFRPGGNDGAFPSAVLHEDGRGEDARVSVSRPLHRPPLSRAEESGVSRFHRDSDGVSLAIVGHGTARHAQSRHATRDMAAWLRRMRIVDEVVTAFLDDDPPVETVVERVTHPTLILAPFLIGAGPHAVRDVPRRVGLNTPDNATPPFFGRVGDRFVICDEPIGSDPRIVELIVELALSGSAGVPQKRAGAIG